MLKKTLFDAWDQNNINEWQRIKADGCLVFMIYTGILKSGLTLFLIFSLVFYLYSDGMLYCDLVSSAITVTINLITSVCGGLAFAHHYWNETDKSFNAFLTNSKLN